MLKLPTAAATTLVITAKFRESRSFQFLTHAITKVLWINGLPMLDFFMQGIHCQFCFAIGGG